MVHHTHLVFLAVVHTKAERSLLEAVLSQGLVYGVLEALRGIAHAVQSRHQKSTDSFVFRVRIFL
eukprot:373818-Amphidinium_carterae.1